MSEIILNQTVSFVDKKAIKRLAAETNRRVGFIKDPTATPQKARDMMRALGIDAEFDNAPQCGTWNNAGSFGALLNQRASYSRML